MVFKLGDIVEATVSFSVMSTKNKTAKLHILLRGLVLLDHTERDVGGQFGRLEKSADTVFRPQLLAECGESTRPSAFAARETVTRCSRERRCMAPIQTPIQKRQTGASIG